MISKGIAFIVCTFVVVLIACFVIGSSMLSIWLFGRLFGD